MPNYYEDVENSSGPKGCSAGPIQDTGKMPTDGTAKQCKIYASEADNKTKIDSCYIEKLRAGVQCPLVNSKSPEATLKDFNGKILFACEYPFELGMPNIAFEKNSLFAYFDSTFPNWRTNASWSEWINGYTLDNYIAQREKARANADRLQAEQKAREAAQAQAKAAADAQAKAEADAKKRAEEASRLQQQLDEANRKLQSCKT
jgi:hypothetical protein